MTVKYETKFGSLKSFVKGRVEPIADDVKHYVFSNCFDIAQKSKPYEKVVFGKNQIYVLEAIRAGVFSPDEPGRFQSIYDLLVNWGDHYLLLADYAAYLEAQQAVDRAYQHRAAWGRQAIANVAGMGLFSSDRTIAEYAREIWACAPVRLPA